jgi:hypothetical protein
LGSVTYARKIRRSPPGSNVGKLRSVLNEKSEVKAPLEPGGLRRFSPRASVRCHQECGVFTKTGQAQLLFRAISTP